MKNFFDPLSAERNKNKLIDFEGKKNNRNEKHIAFTLSIYIHLPTQSSWLT